MSGYKGTCMQGQNCAETPRGWRGVGGLGSQHRLLKDCQQKDRVMSEALSLNAVLFRAGRKY